MAAATSALAAPDVDTDIHARVRVAQMEMIFEQTSVAVFAATAYAIALVLYLHSAVATQTLALWLGLKVAVVIPRVIHGRMFRRRQTDSLRWLYWGDHGGSFRAACRLALLRGLYRADAGARCGDDAVAR